MHLKRWSLLTVAVLAGGTLLLVKQSASANSSANRSADGRAQTQVVKRAAQKGVILVDGAVNPAAVPDVTAYRVFLRVVHDLDAQGQTAALRAYLRRGGIGTPCVKCPAEARSTVGGDEDVATIVKAAKEFTGTDSVLTRKYKEQKMMPGDALAAAGVPYQEARGLLVEHTMADLQTAVSPPVAVALERYVQGHIKSRIKVAGLPSPAGR